MSLVENQDITIFWPKDLVLPKNHDNIDKYVIVGYRINRLKVVVIDSIKLIDFKELNNKIDKDLFKHLEILSCINFKSKKITTLFTTFNFDENKPILTTNQTLIYFKPPNSWKLEYYSLDPISINIFWNNNDQKIEQIFQNPTTTKYAKKMNHHWGELPSRLNNNEMRDVLRIINLTNYIRLKINSNHSNKTGVTSFYDSFNSTGMFVMLMSLFYSIFIRKPCYYLSNFLTYPFLKIKYKTIDSNSTNNSTKYHSKLSLNVLSYTCHQLNLRLKQFYNLPLQFRKLKLSKSESEKSIIKYSNFSPSEYIKFYNTVWLIINDLLLGGIVSSILVSNHDLIVEKIKSIIPPYVNFLNTIVNWLMNSPAGFKLNNELASFMGQLICWVLDLWESTMLKWIVVNVDGILKCIEIIIQFCGLSILMSILLDLNNLIFLNINGFYISCTRLYYWQLNIVRSLFKLFYGKKYNILRNRVDSNDYEFDQLMLGIIIFTILIYLLPTVFIFYLTFITARLVILLTSFVLKFILISINYLPIVVFLLKLKNQERLPSGIILRLDYENDCFILQSRSLTMKEIFESHINSMLHFNLFNLNNERLKDYNRINHENAHQINYVIKDWNRISLTTLTKNILLGEKITDYDYKRMF